MRIFDNIFTSSKIEITAIWAACVFDLRPGIMSEYCRTYRSQVETAQRSATTIATSYERLIANTINSFACCVEQLCGNLHTAALERAIQMVSVDRLKSYPPGKRSAVAAAEGSFSGVHLIRSERVGENADFFQR